MGVKVEQGRGRGKAARGLLLSRKLRECMREKGGPGGEERGRKGLRGAGKPLSIRLGRLRLEGFSFSSVLLLTLQKQKLEACQGRSACAQTHTAYVL